MISRESLIHEYKLTSLEKILSAVLLAIGIGMIIMIKTKLSFASKSNVINNPSFFPRIISVGFIVISIILFLSSLDKKRTDMVTINWFGIMIVGVWVVFGILCIPIGFVLSGIIALAVTLYLFGVRSKKTLILNSIIAPVAVYIVLGVMMGVRLPTLF